MLQEEMTQRCPEWDWATKYLKNLRDYAKVRKIVYVKKAAIRDFARQVWESCDTVPFKD